MKAYGNKNLIVPGVDNYEFNGRKYRKVILNDELDNLLSSIDKYWTPNSEIVTSGIRVPEDSLRIIRTYLVAEKLNKQYPEAMLCKVEDKKGGYYSWQDGWSALLNKGVIINPPLPAKCLMDYFRDGVNKKGQIIGQSPHVKKKAFDLSGLDSLPIIQKLLKEKIIKGYLLERKNNCLHVDIL